jgi:hypothetical protein
MLRRRAWLIIRLTLLLSLALVLLAPEWPAFGAPDFRFRTIVGQGHQFDFLAWTARALLTKTRALLADTHTYLSDDAEKQLVLTYLEQIGRARALEFEIERIYADPTLNDPATAAAAKQAEVDVLRRELAWRQPLAEEIVQRQVAAALTDEGLGVGGLTWPPVLMTMSPVPTMLIVSPRDRIEQVGQAALVPGLSTEMKEEMEDAVFDQLNESALVVPIGGLGTYPAMISETDSMQWLAQVTAHEWTHHWLAFRPLGIRYLKTAELRVINETVASLVDREMGQKVMQSYYPELLAPAITPLAPKPAPATGAPAFNYSAEMAETRDTVDRMLAAGEIEAAEAYMEQRRQVFVNNGYVLRKLNQAYFAFYGGYAAEPGGASGASPIGPMLREIREASPSLRAFLLSVGRVDSYEALVELYRETTGQDPAALSGS